MNVRIIMALYHERSFGMKATVDKEGCIECGLCASTCPEVFRMGEDGPAEAYVDEIPESAEQTAVEAQEGCPVSVITVD